MSDPWGSCRRSPADIDLLFTGDMVLDVEQPDHWLSGIAPALHAADLSIGHLEVPHTLRGHELAGDVPAPGSPPEHLDALQRAGVAALTLAGNHIADCGAEGIADTIARLDQLGIAHCGAGASLAQARQPALLESRGRRIALLSYNCVGPENAWAGVASAGCNYLPLLTADGSPVAPAADLRDIAPEALRMLRNDVAAARERAGLVVVALHKGIVHTPARLAPYERPLAEAALRAGADLVVGHHAHILRGIEFPNNRPVFHGLGNGCVVTRALSPAQDHPGRAAWARRRQELFGFVPDPRYEFAPFHPQAVHAALARVLWREDGSLVAGITPVHVEPPGRPVLVMDERADAVVDYFSRIGRDAGLPEMGFHRASRELWTCAPAGHA
jgi:poly-gamma-glutamate capsule biosynthesis protein CapA/YwtB (metallophosphatase superfamily)